MTKSDFSTANKSLQTPIPNTEIKNKKPNFIILAFILGIGIVFWFGFRFYFEQRELALILAPEKKTAIINSIAKNMIYVQGGTFKMGSNDTVIEARPIHSVTLSSFYIGKYEVTQLEWRAIMGNNPSNHEDCDKCPIENVSWDDVQKFIEKLNRKTGKKYRLPTEAEWEFAAKGGNKSKGYILSGSDNFKDVAYMRSYRSNGKTYEVGQKKANELGIFDMTGNVAEWCQDLFDADYYANSPTENPTGPAMNPKSDTTVHRVTRGGGQLYLKGDYSVADRWHSTPGVGDGGLGFRIVLIP